MLALISAIASGVIFGIYGYLDAQYIHEILTSSDRETRVSHLMWANYAIGAILVFSFTILFYLTAVVGGRFTRDLRRKCITAILNQDMEFFDLSFSEDLSSRLGKDCRQASNLGGTVMSI